MKNQIIKAAHQAKIKIASYKKHWDKNLEELKSQSSESRNRLREKINRLEMQLAKKDDINHNKIERHQNHVHDTMLQMYKPIEKLNRILLLMGVVKEPPIDLSLTVNKDRYATDINLIDNPINDKYLNLQVYIFENKKPKNKYTLCVAGNSIFGRKDLIRFPYSYGVDISFVNHYTSILSPVTVAPTKEKLIEYYNKHKDFIIAKVTLQEEHTFLIKDYEWVVANCNTKEWEMEYLLSQKKYWEGCVRNGIEDPEYKIILKQIAKLKKK